MDTRIYIYIYIYTHMHTMLLLKELQTSRFSRQYVDQSAGAAAYTDCFSTEGYDPHNKCPRYDTKQSDGEVSVMLQLWGEQCASSLLFLPGPLWSGEVAPDKSSIYGLNRTKPLFLDLPVVVFF